MAKRRAAREKASLAGTKHYAWVKRMPEYFVYNGHTDQKRMLGVLGGRLPAEAHSAPNDMQSSDHV